MLGTYPRRHIPFRPLEVLLPGRSNSCTEYGTPDFHVDFVEGAHDGLDPVLVDLHEEAFDGFLGSHTRRVRGDGVASGGGRLRAHDNGLMEEQKLDVAAGDEARDVAVEELVDALQIPGKGKRNCP